MFKTKKNEVFVYLKKFDFTLMSCIFITKFYQKLCNFTKEKRIFQTENHFETNHLSIKEINLIVAMTEYNNHCYQIRKLKFLLINSLRCIRSFNVCHVTE
ncbi:hypothetical protein BpHYR1_022407 [Brachionus plicatilis]|uniref:Uncharacterized protein n=1 Tax=Brachionus plicatilis TaxID=10195 RepID=A0A3M7R2F5_BRAPC|nr:hypothetical protein BpHYR1_022407 [Brachionus plicatilis]